MIDFSFEHLRSYRISPIRLIIFYPVNYNIVSTDTVDTY